MFPGGPQQRSIITNVDLMETQYFIPIKFLTDLIDVNVHEIMCVKSWACSVIKTVSCLPFSSPTSNFKFSHILTFLCIFFTSSELISI
jgi:hypothetical protein